LDPSQRGDTDLFADAAKNSGKSAASHPRGGDRPGVSLLPAVGACVPVGLPIVTDTVGEFTLDIWNRGFPFPAGLILPKFQPDVRRREFANSIQRYSRAKESGNLVSYCVWGRGVDALLPVAQKVILIRVRGEDPVAIGDWDRVREVVGVLMEQTDDYPPRFRVREFPSEEALAAIGKGET
jgi:hypothetical protein